MNSKVKIILFVILGLLVVVVLLAIYVASGKPKLKVPGVDGQKIEVMDFMSTNPQDSAFTTPIAESESFSIQYDKINNTFQIAFTVTSGSALKTARSEAELKLLQILGINSEQLCRLNVLEIVPDNGVLSLPTYNFPPSFCAGGNVIP